jgi:hypothetical protein
MDCCVISFGVGISAVICYLASRRLHQLGEPATKTCAIWYDPILKLYVGSERLRWNPALNHCAFVLHYFEAESTEHFAHYVESWVKARNGTTP